jgi:hypothetical protein
MLITATTIFIKFFLKEFIMGSFRCTPVTENSIIIYRIYPNKNKNGMMKSESRVR